MPSSSAEEMYASETSRLRFEAFRYHVALCFVGEGMRHEQCSAPSTLTQCCFHSRLQAAAVAFGEQLPIPEIVAIGGQVKMHALQTHPRRPHA